ncbi:hypothetical protein ABZ766_13690 [Streptomyces sp. NPDC006670]|uniref:hypothetical protein n=1 Tax=Streptomyces sp. NPDC006670 TaxID=3154476 RepID=UPI0033F1FBBF
MLTYQEVMTINLGVLAAAAGKRESMAAELAKVEERYGDTVQQITLGQDWLGL